MVYKFTGGLSNYGNAFDVETAPLCHFALAKTRRTRCRIRHFLNGVGGVQIRFDGIALRLLGQPALERNVCGGMHCVHARHGAVVGTNFKHFSVFGRFLCFYRITNKNNDLY